MLDFSRTTAQYIQNADIDELTAYIIDTDRQHPVLLVTTSKNSTTPNVDLDQLIALGACNMVIVVINDDVTTKHSVSPFKQHCMRNAPPIEVQRAIILLPGFSTTIRRARCYSIPIRQSIAMNCVRRCLSACLTMA